ncbi:MAG: hypothetical protein E7813_03760 [Bradyrhizobium sp.]|nr:MAG: hypothetical protein E7813_03760 [Bradyrhizobium sp.]
MIGIYQPFFKPELVERLDRGFLALDWLPNPAPALRELALHKHIADRKIYEKHQLTGVLSAKFFSKTKLKSEQVYNWILDNPKHDIYLVNGFPYVPYAGYNNVERTIIQRGYPFDILMRKLCRRIGLELPEEFPRQIQANLCLCSYWIASATFWESWTGDVIAPIFELLGSGNDTDEFLRYSNYRAPTPVYELTFIYEQLINYYIAQKNINAIYYPWNAQSILSLNYHPDVREYLQEMIPLVDRMDAAGPWSDRDKAWLRERCTAVHRVGGSAKEVLTSDPADFDLPRFYPMDHATVSRVIRGYVGRV